MTKNFVHQQKELLRKMNANLAIYESNEGMKITIKQLEKRISRTELVLKFHAMTNEEIIEEYIIPGTETNFLD